MARYRTRPINPFLQLLMDLKGVKSLSVIQAQTGEAPKSLKSLADTTDSNQVLEFHLNMAEYWGVSLDVWTRGLLGRLSTRELNELKDQIQKAS